MWFGSGGSTKPWSSRTAARSPARDAGRQLGRGDPADEVGGDGGRVGGVEEAPHGDGEITTEVVVGDHPIEQPAPGDVVLDGLREEVADVEHLDTAVGQRVGERVVLLAGALDPQHVVEEQLAAVGRGEAAELEVRTVQQHPSQDPDLGVHVESGHGPIVHRRSGRHVGPMVLAVVTDGP